MMKSVPRNQVITDSDIKMSRISSSDVPSNVVTSPDEVVGKVSLVSLSPGVTVTTDFFDAEGLTPKEGEEIFPIPREAIYSINTSLRERDLIDISLYSDVRDQDIVPNDTVWKNVKVVAVRNDAGNMIRDTETGNNNDRLTATDRVGPVELLVSNEDARAIRDAVSSGYKLWISRVN